MQLILTQIFFLFFSFLPPKLIGEQEKDGQPLILEELHCVRVIESVIEAN